MIVASTDTVQPAIDLAALALCRTDSPEVPPAKEGSNVTEDAGLGSIDGAIVSGPLPLQSADTDMADLVEVVAGEDNVVRSHEDKDDAKSDTSMRAMDFGEQTDQNAPAPPSRPPPIPPRPDAQASIKIGKLEESARQQDAAEVMGNIFDLISCAIKGEDIMREGEQFDTIKKLFYSDVTTVRNTAKGVEKLSELRDHFLVSPGGRDRSIYATLDNDFGQGEMDGGETRYDYIDHAAPIQIINLRRLQFDGGEPVYDRSHIELESTLYLDRYLGKTKSLAELQLLELREAQWTQQRKLREVDEARQTLQATDLEGMDVADSIAETSVFLKGLISYQSEQMDLRQPSLPTPPMELVDALQDKAQQLKKELEDMSSNISQLETEVDNVFQNCKDHPYRLHAVFTHSGGTKGGHYWIYIYDFQAGLWRSYNDDRVTIAEEKQILEREDGGARPKVSTGVVYVRADLVEDYTQAVCRRPKALDMVNTSRMPVDTADVTVHENETLSAPEPIKYNDLDILVGVEKQ